MTRGPAVLSLVCVLTLCGDGDLGTGGIAPDDLAPRTAPACP